MRAFTGLIFAAILVSACGNPPTLVRSNAATPANDRAGSTIAHGPTSIDPAGATPTNSGPPANTAKTKWTQSGDPIDTAALDAAIAKANKDLKAKPSDAGLKKAAAEAYFNRGAALTEARQYAAALGDYRKAFKIDASNVEAKNWIDKIIMIYDGLNKDSPKEGEEPGALPWKK